MNKSTAKGKNNKVKKNEDLLISEVDLEEAGDAPAQELDPDILKVLVKPKKNKNNIDSTDYIPELEREIEDDFSADGSGF